MTINRNLASGTLRNKIARQCFCSLAKTKGGAMLTEIAELTGLKSHEVQYRVRLLREAGLVERVEKASHMDVYGLSEYGAEWLTRVLSETRPEVVPPVINFMKNTPSFRAGASLSSEEIHRQIADFLLEAAQVHEKLAKAFGKLDQKAA